MSRPDPPSDSPVTDEDFLARWSRRKQEVRAAPSEIELAVQEPVEDQPPALTDEDMPPVETLDENSDFSGFMSPEVSDGLRKMALRKMFSIAGFNVRDGLDDYDDDFTSFAKLGDLITSDMRFQMEQEARDQEEQLASADETQSAGDQPADGEAELDRSPVETRQDEHTEIVAEECETVAAAASNNHETAT